MLSDDPLRILDTFPLFASLPRDAAGQLFRLLRAREVACGQALVVQGDPGDSLFLVADGRFEARVTLPGGEPRAIGVIGRGETIGEMAVITGGARACTVLATRRSSVLELSGDDFLRVLEQHPAALFDLTRRMIRRSTQAMPRSPTRRIALLPLDPRVDVTWLGKALEEALSAFGSTVRLGRALVVAHHGQAKDDSHLTVPRLSTRLLDWLAAQEEAHEFVVYDAAHARGEWTQRCLAQADLILLVADADGAPDPGLLEQDLLGPEQPVTLAPTQLVLLRPDRASRPAGTARWLDARKVEQHHHVAVGERADVERLARIIAGRAIQLVLSGGGVRGFAGIGVIRALREAGIPIDQVGGASCGSLIASLAAMEWDADRMRDTLVRWARGRPSINDPTFPFLSLFAARRGTRAAREICDGWAIEDLPIGYFAVSTDLRHAEEVVHRRGPLWAAVRASTSVPGAFPPLVTGGRCLVDGGVLNNLPIDVMARIGRGRIVAVDTGRQVSLDPEALALIDNGEDGSMSGLRLLLRRLASFFRRRKEPMLHIGDIVARASEVASVRIARGIQAETEVALRIEPPVDGYRMLDFDAIEPVVEAGYTFARERTAAWKATLLTAE